MTSAIERELKFDAGADFSLPDLAKVVAGATLTARPPQRLQATYYDTADLRLLRWGATLRHRIEGERAEWTVKLATNGDGAALRARRELTFAADGGSPPPAALSVVLGLTGAAAVRPVARLVTTRSAYDLRAADGAPLAEVDDDNVVAYRGKRVAARFREVEVELCGEVDDALVQAVTRRLRKAGAAPATSANKLSRVVGDRLHTHAEAPAGRGRVSLTDVVRAALASGAQRLVRHDPLVRLGDASEPVHQARVATRRLRSDLHTFAPFVDDGWASAVSSDLAWIGDALGAVRDADVLADRLLTSVAGLPRAERPAADLVFTRLATRRASARDALLAVLDSPRYLNLLETLLSAGDLAVDAPAGDARRALREVVHRRWDALEAEVGGLQSETAPALHKVRIAAKRCRYALEASRPLLGRDAAAAAAAAADLQTVLGDFNDAVVTEAWLRRAASAASAPTALVVGQLIASERAAQDQARSAWRPAWRRARRVWRRSPP